MKKPQQIMGSWKLFFMIIWVALSTVTAAEYYVAMDGDDSNPGTAAEPWATIQHGADIAQAGDTIHVMAGNYNQTARFTSPGEAENMIRCVAEGYVLIDAGGEDWGLFIDGYEDNNGRYVELNGFSVTNASRGGVRISWANGVIVRNCECFSNGRWGIFTDYSDDSQILDNLCYDNIAEHGIYVSNSSDRPVIRGNRCRDNNACGIQINADPAMPGDGITSNALIENNICTRNGDAGGAAINLASVRDSIIRNNLLYTNHAGGIACWGDGNGPEWGSKNNVFFNNTIVFDNGEGRWCISLKEASTNAVILNNILIGGDNGALEFDTDSYSGLLSNYNIMHSRSSDVVVTEEDLSYMTLSQWQSTGQDSQTLDNAPGQLFETQGSSSAYWLLPGCGAVDSGAESHGDIPATDRIGHPRCDDPDTTNTGEGSGIMDRGCHEMCQGIPTPTPGVTPTVTPLPWEIQVSLTMPSTLFTAGDICSCTVSVVVNGNEPVQEYPLIVILDVLGALYFAPSFSLDFDTYLDIHPEFAVGETVIPVLEPFSWPDGASEMTGIFWYAGITDPGISILISNAAMFEFGWE